MNPSRTAIVLLESILLSACGSSAQAPFASPPPPLGGTSWRLVKFQGGDDTTLSPDDRAKYTIEFGADGSLGARIDCNRGRGTWKSSEPSHVEFGPLALTRAMCPPGSLHDRIVKHWPYFRSYVVRNGHLFLALMADGGIYEFEPLERATSASSSSPVGSTGPFTFECAAGGGATTLKATFYQTQPAMVLLARGGEARPAFQVPSASGARYEGYNTMFWEARDEAMVTWSGVELKCKRQ